MQTDARHLRPWWPQHSLDSLELPPVLRPWLLHAGSMTQRLQTHEKYAWMLRSLLQ